MILIELSCLIVGQGGADLALVMFWIPELLSSRDQGQWDLIIKMRIGLIFLSGFVRFVLHNV